jgi:hypothetical protein
VNCQDMNHLLDTSAEDLTSAQRESIDLHLASCHACSEDWANWRAVSALQIPATPTSLAARIAATLPARFAPPVRRPGRPYVVAGVLLACAAAAATLVTLYTQPDQEPSSTRAEFSHTTVPLAQENQKSVVAGAAAGADLPLDSGSTASIVIPAVADVPMDPHGIVVLIRPEAAADLRAVAIATQCHDAIVSQLRAIRGLNVLADAAVSAYEGNEQASRLPGSNARFELQSADQQLARRVGAGNVLVVSTGNYCAATLFNSQTGQIITGLMSGTALPPDDGWKSFAANLARNVRDKTLVDEAALPAEYRKVLLDSSLGDHERMEALDRIMQLRVEPWKKAPRGAFDKEVIAAAVQLGTKSQDSDTRSGVWASMRGINDPSLAQPMMQSLANDPDGDVRMQAAFSLNLFLDIPGVREALLRAAAEDPSREPQVACCIYTVREAAERASIADKDLKAWMRSKLLDESLPARSRLLNAGTSTPDSRFQFLSASDMGPDGVRAIFNIGSNEQDPRVRQMAWGTLERVAPDDTFMPVLLGDLTSHPDEYVRSAAAKVLKNYQGNPSVREALERARSDSSMAVRREAGAALGGSGN